MRVVGGLYRHRELKMSDSNITRPTKDMVKEGFFSAINYKVNNSIVLDLFAGSGSLGIEALSRGAKECYFIDNDKTAIKTINDNVNSLNIANAIVLKRDYREALDYFLNNNIKFDLVIVDPPYKLDIYKDVVDILINSKLLNNNAVIVLESDNKLDINVKCNKIKDYKYGRTLIKILWL